MTTTTTPLDQIDASNLATLLENRVPEGRDLEFKRDAIGRDDAAKKEFLKDVSALANTAGGDLIIGVGEEQGIAASLHGITSAPSDAEIRRLESVLQDGIEPRLIGTRMHAVPLVEGGYVLLIRVQASWNPPHRVIYQRTNRFYARNSAGTYELDVEQLRAAFLGAAEVERRLEDLRLERLARLKGGVGTGLIGPGHLVLHLAPLQPTAAPPNIRTVADPNAGFGPMGSSGWNETPNFDGLLLRGGRTDDEGRYGCLTQVFRNGRLEAGRGAMLFSRQESGYPRVLSYADSVPDLIESIPRYARALVKQGVPAPFGLMVSLLDVRGSVMLHDSRWMHERPRLDRDDLLFELLVLEDVNFAEGWQAVLMPMFDAWWNAYGWQRCFDLYDEAGTWTGYPRKWPV